MKSREAVKLAGMELSPRAGTIGLWDRIVGPGSTRTENALIIVWGSLCAAAVVAYPLIAGLGWSTLQLAVVAFIALDICGGVPANVIDSAKRWYHRPGQSFRHFFLFNVAHLHPFALALLFPDFGWLTATAIYAYLLVAAAMVLAAPAHLKRPAAFVLYSLVLLGGLYVLVVPLGLEWFVPLFFLKLLIAHLLPENASLPST